MTIQEKMQLTQEEEQQIIDYLKTQDVDFVDYEDFLAYMHERGVRNSDIGIIDKYRLTNKSAEKFYKEYANPIKKASKLLNLTYKELAEITGYTEAVLKTAVSKNQVSNLMEHTFNILMENDSLKKELADRDNTIQMLKEKIIEINKILQL